MSTFFEDSVFSTLQATLSHIEAELKKRLLIKKKRVSKKQCFEKNRLFVKACQFPAL